MLAGAVRSNVAMVLTTLKHWDERKEDSFSIVRRYWGALNAVVDGTALVLNPPAINGLSLAGGFEIYLQDRNNGSIEDLEKYANLLVSTASQRPELTSVRSLLDANIPQYSIVLDREKAKSLKVTVDEVFSTLQSTFGQRYVNDFNLYGKTYQVNMQAKSEFLSLIHI